MPQITDIAANNSHPRLDMGPPVGRIETSGKALVSPVYEPLVTAASRLSLFHRRFPGNERSARVDPQQGAARRARGGSKDAHADTQTLQNGRGPGHGRRPDRGPD